MACLAVEALDPTRSIPPHQTDSVLVTLDLGSLFRPNMKAGFIDQTSRFINRADRKLLALGWCPQDGRSPDVFQV
jgi:hypothetical protein